MKTIINMIPSAPSRLQAPVELTTDWADRLAVETDVAYSFNITASSNRVYRGSMKVLAENSANNAGTRRLLLKIELPLTAQETKNSENGCCCQSAADEVPMVSVHTVITVPKSVVAALTKGDVTATDQLSVVIRLLQNLLAGVCHQPILSTADPNGVLADGAVIMTDGGLTTGNVMMPLHYDASSGQFTLDVGIPDNAPIWGMIGGLQRLS